MRARRPCFLEKLVVLVVAALLVGYGWLVLLNEGVFLSAKGRSAHLTNEAALYFAGGVFLCAALFAYFAAKLLQFSAGVRWFAVAITLIPPAVFMTMLR